MYSQLTWCLMSTETIRLIRDGEKGEGLWRWGKREVIYLSLHCHHQNNSCIKMGSDESHFSVSLIYCEGPSHKTVSTDHNFLKREESRSGIEPRSSLSAYQPLPLGDQTGSQSPALTGHYRHQAPVYDIILPRTEEGAGKRGVAWSGRPLTTSDQRYYSK